MDVLVVDDEAEIVELLSRFLQHEGHLPTGAQSGADALARLEAGVLPDLIISDVRMPGMDGLELLRRVRDQHPDIHVIMCTGYGTVDSAVEAMRLGAYSYIGKPINFEELRANLARLERAQRLQEEVQTLRLELRKQHPGGTAAEIIGSSPAMRQVVAHIRKIARSNLTVLIHGESGTGKELVARAIHYQGARAKEPFLAINCGGISRSLLSSQLFGHVKGAFTGAHSDAKGYLRASHGGTLLLDEVTEMDPDVQIEFLRALQEREITPVGATSPIPIDVRILAATNRDLTEALESGRMRQDLYYRLSVAVIRIPTLRERKSDIPELLNYFNERFSREYGIAPKRISPDTLDRLMEHEWPGNIRELENVFAHAFTLAEGDTLELPPGFEQRTDAVRSAAAEQQARDAPASDEALPSLKDLEQTLLTAAVREAVEAPEAARQTVERLQRLQELVARAAGVPVPESPASSPPDAEGNGELPTLAEAEKALLQKGLEACGGVKSHTARMLDIEPRRLNRLLKRHGLE